jgi:glycosyltransferase involved in cell wall biosynthesis
VLALLEADSITGTAKPVLEMAYEAQADISGQRRIELSVANFARGRQEVDNALTSALREGRIPYSLIREKGRFDSSVLPQIRDLVKKYDAEVVWTNSVKSHFLVYESGVLKQRKWVAFHHGYTSTDFKMSLYNQLDRVSLRKADRVLTVCIPLVAELEDRGVLRRRIRVQHMPVRPFINSPEDGIALRSELGLTSDTKVILSVGRMSREKGQKHLITSFSLLRKRLQDNRLKLVLVGEGPERKNLERRAAHCHVNDSVVFAGHRDDAKRFYGIADVFALSSYSEGTPNVLLEAMAAAVPVVATAVGGIPELASDGRHALLVPAADPVALANALSRILQAADLRHTLVQTAKEVVAGHTPRSYFKAMREIFLETIME